MIGSGSLSDIAQSALLLLVWLGVSYMFINVAWTGRFWTWQRKANGKVWPPVRAETPFQFWLVWSLLAAPFIIFTVLFAIGVVVSVTGSQ